MTSQALESQVRGVNVADKGSFSLAGWVPSGNKSVRRAVLEWVLRRGSSSWSP